MALHWQAHNPLVNGPTEFHGSDGPWSALVTFEVARCVEEWVIQVWNRQEPNGPSISSLYDDYAGYNTARDAMRGCEQWIADNGD